MKKCLVIICHPSIDTSFNHRLAKAAVDHLTEIGHEVRYVDLYKIGFNPSGGVDDFVERNDETVFHYQFEQKHAVVERNLETFEPQLREQMELVTWADWLIFQFPMYWFSVPAVLKGWMDKVLAYYFAYGGGQRDENGIPVAGALAGKSVLFSFTTGGSRYTVSALKRFFSGFEMSWRLCGCDPVCSYCVRGVNFLKMVKKKPVRPTEKHYQAWIAGLLARIDQTIGPAVEVESNADEETEGVGEGMEEEEEEEETGGVLEEETATQ